MSSPKIKKICRTCGSDDVTADAWASWDVDTQEWVLHSVYENEYCQTCEMETKLVDEVITDDN